MGHFAGGTEARGALARLLAGETRTPTAGKYATATANAAEAQFALENGVDNYSKKQYNDFGWTRDGDVLNAGQSQDFFSKFAAAKSGQATYPKTKSGEYMIEVSDIHDPVMEGVNNTIVYAKGLIDSPQITRVVEINIDSENEIDLDRKRRELYAAERRGIQPEAGEVFRQYSASDFKFHNKGNSNQGITDSGRIGSHRGRSGAQAQRVKSIRFDEDGNEVSRTYHDTQFSLILIL